MNADEEFHKRVHERHMKTLRNKLVQTFVIVTVSALAFTVIYIAKHGVS